MNKENSLSSIEIASLADYILNREGNILQEWRNQVSQEQEQPNSLISLSRQEFYNSIPEFIENIRSVFEEDNSFLEKISRKHGSQRYEYGFDLKALTEEWSRLYLILMKHVNDAEDVINIGKYELKEAQQRLAQFIHRAIRNSVDEYFNLQKLKAESQIEDLETAIQENETINLQRGHSLQSASHDVGGSMVVMKMNLALLKKKDLNPEAKELVDQLSMAADSLSQLLDNLLELFRLEAGRESLEIEEFDAADLLNELGENMKSLVEAKGLELQISGEDSLPVKGDPLKVKRIAQNLLLNSLKYTDSGHIEICWKKEDDNYWRLEITDTGPGIGSTNAALFTDTSKIAKKSETAPALSKNQGPEEVRMHSEGIGLLIIRQLCQLLNAVVKIDLDREVGTSFKINFPIDYSNSE